MMRHLFGRKKRFRKHINLHETFTDSAITGDDFAVRHGEGRLHAPIGVRQLGWLGLVFFALVAGIAFRVAYLQIAQGETYISISENNSFDHTIVLPIRGAIYDRSGTPLAWNSGSADRYGVPKRYYIGEGFSSLLGFIGYPRRDTSGEFYRQETEGKGGIEEMYNHLLAGGSGSLVLEKDALGKVLSELYIEKPIDGENVVLSIDAEIQKLLYETIATVAEKREFQAGSGILLNSETGEIIALASYPDFDNNVLTNHPEEEKEEYLRRQKGGVFVHRAISGLYSPGSTIKPFFALAALEKDIISPIDIIRTTGSISIQNPYDPDIVYVYKDWKDQGSLNMYDAIAWSSNVYFYHIGGGYKQMDGLGIDRMKEYADLFRFGQPTRLGVFNEPDGLVPSPAWKKETHGEEWRIGDTYNTVIGQYAFQATPLQIVRALAAIANNGYLLEPHLRKDVRSDREPLGISDEHLRTVRSGMRRTVTEGTAKALNNGKYTIAAKTGTAQVGRGGIVDSLLIGFVPYKHPKYAFIIIMERGEQDGAVLATRSFFDAVTEKYPDFFQ